MRLMDALRATRQGRPLTSIVSELRWCRGRRVGDLTSRVAAELGVLTLKIAYERWTDTTNGDEFGEVARRTPNEVQAASSH